VASAVGVVAALVAQLSVGIAGVVAAAAWPALSVVMGAGRMFATAPAVTPAHLATPPALLLLVAFALRRRSPRVALASIAVVVVTSVGAPWAAAPDVEVLTLVALNVGQGDALLVEVPGEARPRLPECSSTADPTRVRPSGCCSAAV
jgi:beta-lactamase superfamily II metal-dependent hydrolase